MVVFLVFLSVLGFCCLFICVALLGLGVVVQLILHRVLAFILVCFVYLGSSKFVVSFSILGVWCFGFLFLFGVYAVFTLWLIPCLVCCVWVSLGLGFSW